MPIKTSDLFILLALLSLLLFALFSFANAQSIDELKSRINEKNVSIQKLEEEIVQYQKEIEVLGQEADSLKNTLKSLDISKKKLEADIKITENRIATKNLEIKELSLQIGDKSERITDSKRVISQSLYAVSQIDSASVIETLLSKQTFSDIWNNTDELSTLQGSMQDRIKELENLKSNLEDNKKQTEQKKAELISLTNDLKNQTKIIADTVKEKNSILDETKNTEANYKKSLALKKIQKEEFEKEMLDLESALKIAIDPKSIPSTGSGVLKWPLDKIRITQYFGNTEFASRNPQAYSGKGHNGVDFGTAIGTPVKAALSGTVVGFGNMDLAGGGKCRSYGKWIMIKHPNGLSTLYGHLSLINVSENQTVYTGEVIGYSGNTGYSTGPHLHFSVYATEGVRITQLTNSINCKNAIVPLADLKAYLNPLSYL